MFRDHPECFWVDSSKLAWGQTGSDDNGNDVYALECKLGEQSFFYEGFTTDNLQRYRNDLAAKVEEIMRGMPPTAQDELAQLKYLNDWIALHNVYNASGVGATNFSRCAASGLLSDNTTDTTDDDPVCYGYATAMKVLLDACGIENAYIEGWAYNGKTVPASSTHGITSCWMTVTVRSNGMRLTRHGTTPAHPACRHVRCISLLAATLRLKKG